MSRLLRWLGIALATLIALCVALYLFVNMGGGRWLFTRWVNRQYPALENTFACSRVQVSPTGHVTLIRPSACVGPGCWNHGPRRDAMYIGARRVRWTRPDPRMPRLQFTVTDAELDGRSIRVQGGQLTWDSPWPGQTDDTGRVQVGTLSAREATFGQLAVTYLQGTIVQVGDEFVVEPLTMQAYAGALTGRLRVIRAPALHVVLDLAADRILLGELEGFNQMLFHGAAGELAGRVHVNHSAETGLTFNGTFTVLTPGGTIGAQMLQVLLPYLPRTAERERLRQAVKRQELVPFQSAELVVTVDDPQQVKTVLTMAIPEYNLLLDHVTVDIRVEDPQVLRQLSDVLRTLTE